VRWATRPGCHVDRAACAWLLRRFIDPDAEFVFVDDTEDLPPDATAFDMRGDASPCATGADVANASVRRRA
jgi:hypothetical protein